LRSPLQSFFAIDNMAGALLPNWWAMQKAWELVLPDFTFGTWGGFAVGLVESFVAGFLTAVIFVPVYNFFAGRHSPKSVLWQAAGKWLRWSTLPAHALLVSQSGVENLLGVTSLLPQAVKPKSRLPCVLPLVPAYLGYFMRGRFSPSAGTAPKRTTIVSPRPGDFHGPFGARPPNRADDHNAAGKSAGSLGRLLALERSYPLLYVRTGRQKTMPMFTIEEIQTTFTDWAPRYDATHAWRLLKRREARLALDVQPGDWVVEIACGTGLNFPHLRQLVGEAGHLVGVDLTPAMLDIAREQVYRIGWKNVEVREADAARLPFPDASFDKAFCAFALNIIPEYERAIGEVWRVLIPGGRFVALEMRSMDLGAWSGWPARLAHRLMGVCKADASHRSLEAIQRTFGDVKVRRYLAGMVYVAVAKKSES
jgi:demethylmenaquinone methyltransferase/2-methoxy-6-polyprenyl-1,4-benzoquinol methylase